MTEIRKTVPADPAANDLRLATGEAIEEFTARMELEMELHRAEKGDWRELDNDDCLACITHIGKMIQAGSRGDLPEARKQCIHTANYLCILFHRLGEEKS